MNKSSLVESLPQMKMIWTDWQRRIQSRINQGKRAESVVVGDCKDTEIPRKIANLRNKMSKLALVSNFKLNRYL